MALSRNEKIGLGIGAAAILIGGGMYAYKKHKASQAAANGSATSGGSTPAGGTTTSGGAPSALYSLAPAVAIDSTSLPMLNMGGANGAKSYWVAGDETAQGLVNSKQFVPLAPGFNDVMTLDTSYTQPGATTTWLSDFSAQIAQHGIDGLPGGSDGSGSTIPASDLWIFALGPNESAVDQTVAAQDIAQLRKVLVGQRILWVLAKSTDPSIAQALTQANEEWVRSSGDTSDQIATDATNALMAQDVTSLNSYFPPPAPSV